jgi:hypothetical protein
LPYVRPFSWTYWISPGATVRVDRLCKTQISCASNHCGFLIYHPTGASYVIKQQKCNDELDGGNEATYEDWMDDESLESARERLGGDALWPATEVLGGGVSTILPGNDFEVDYLASSLARYKC